MERGYVSALAMNGAGIIHDFEVALAGATSEDVDEALGPGRFGMADETGRHPERGDRRGKQRAGASVRRSASTLPTLNPPHASRSLAVAAIVWEFRSRCMSRSAPTSSTCTRRRPGPRSASASLRDFRYFTSSCRASVEAACISIAAPPVVLPEVFLKAVALARNQGVALDRLTTVNIDFLRMYRPQTNVVSRPVAGTAGPGFRSSATTRS